ncbi:MAG: tetratricopeptide repeat protein [Patescibacteria group bacterium]
MLAIVSGIRLCGIHGLGLRYQLLFKNPNTLASFLILGLPFSISIFLGLKKGFSKTILAIFVILGIFNLVFTYSRIPLLAFFISLVFLVFNYKRKYFIYIFIILILITAIFVLGTVLTHQLQERLFNLGGIIQETILPRLATYKAALKIFFQSSTRGIGLGNFGFVYFRYLSSPVWHMHTHNIFLQNLVESGILGLVFFVLVIFNLSRLFFYLKNWLNHQDFRLNILLGLGAGLVAILAHNQFDYSLWSPVIGLFFWLFLGVISGLYFNYYYFKKIGAFKAKLIAIFIFIFWLGFILRPFVASIFFRKGIALAEGANEKEAVVYLEKASGLDRHPLYQAHLADLYAKDNLKRAIFEYKKAISSNPLDASFYNNLAWLYYQQGNLGLAEEALTKATRLDPFSFFGPHYIDLAFIELENSPLQEQLVQEVLNGIIRGMQIGFNSAGCIPNKVLEHLSKTDKFDALFLAELYFYSQNFNQALTYYKKAALHNQDVYINLALARTNIKLNRFKEALDILDPIILKSPDIKESYLLKSLIFEKQNKIDESIKDLEKALSIDPLEPEANIRLYLEFKEKGLLDKARNQLKRVQFLCGDSFYSPVTDIQYVLKGNDIQIIDKFSCQDNLYLIQNRLSQILYQWPLMKGYSLHP